jgi:putative ABC transport system permease protein
LDGLGQQLRYTLRKLQRAPLFSTVAVLTLAVGIGANAAIFSVVNGVLLKPLPFEDPDELVGVWHKAPGLGFDNLNQSPALHFTYVDENRTFTSVGMWDQGTVSVTGLAEPEQIPAMYVTHQTLPLLRVRPVLGRVFLEEDDSPGTPETVILAHGYWERRLGADPGVLGTTISIDGRPREIIGVMPEDLHFLDANPDVYLPFRFDRTQAFVGNFSYQALGRLAPGATVSEANADIERMLPIAFERFPGPFSLAMARQAGFGANVHPLKEDVVGDVGSVLWVLLGTVAIVLLIACANVANLFIVRAEGRQREMAVRTAMGAGRRQITGQLLLESLVLGLVGGALGLLLAFGGLRLLVWLAPPNLPRLAEIGLDPVVLAFTGALSVFAGMLFGLFPSLRFGASSLVGALKEGGRGGGAGKEQHVARNALVVAQMALALVLLAGSGLMIRSFEALRSVNPGFTAPEEVLTFRVAIPSAEMSDWQEYTLAFREMLSGVQSIPGVEAAAYSTSITMDGWDNNDPIEAEGFPLPPDQIPPIRRLKQIGEGYFSTMGNPVLAGRELTWADVDDQARVVVITENLAREYWGEPTEAVGKRIRRSAGSNEPGEWFEVVGVVGNAYDDGIAAGPVATVYWPQVTVTPWSEGVEAPRSLAFAVRARTGDPNALLPSVREAVWAVNPNLPIASVRTLQEISSGRMAQTSFTLVLLAIAAGVALFLGSVGIYGVVSYVVAQRTREIGIRMAMGAERSDVRSMVLKQAGLLAGVGVAVGLLAASGLTRLMASLLFGVDPLDPATFGTVALGLSCVALVASWIPARRASRVDPVVALRFE